MREFDHRAICISLSIELMQELVHRAHAGPCPQTSCRSLSIELMQDLVHRLNVGACPQSSCRSLPIELYVEVCPYSSSKSLSIGLYVKVCPQSSMQKLVHRALWISLSIELYVGANPQSSICKLIYYRSEVYRNMRCSKKQMTALVISDQPYRVSEALKSCPLLVQTIS